MGHKVYVVGLGPGDGVYLTLQARAALEAADVLCGYTAYVALAAAQFPCKETYATGMREEIERCRWALATAAQGKTVALVCSGDAGVYGMAGLLLQMGKEFTDVDIEVVPGVTAAVSGAALLGAPLGHDFCVISLSDLLTPWDVIEKRLRCAAAGDFVLCLYNTASRKRADYLRRACNVLLSAGKKADTVCGLARNIGREGERVHLLTLEALRETPADMYTTVFIGASSTIAEGGRMITPRGYERKEKL